MLLNSDGQNEPEKVLIEWTLLTRNWITNWGQVKFNQAGWRNLSFYESYFSNYIEGTEFEIDEADKLPDQGVPRFNKQLAKLKIQVPID